jgi:Flp pilus assembly protein TadD
MPHEPTRRTANEPARVSDPMPDTTIPNPATPDRRRWFAALALPLRRAGRRFSRAPRSIRLGLVLVVVVGIAAGAYYSQVYLKSRAREREVAARWRDFDEAAASTDLPAMSAALDRLLAASPADPAATRRKVALDSGSADEADPDVAGVLMNHHAASGRLGEAAREARKVVARSPKNWRALCVLAHHAIQVNADAGEARKWLEALPDPEDPDARLDAGGLLCALRLSESLGRGAAPLRAVIVRRLLPLLRGELPQSAPPAAKAQLVECYLEPFADRANLAELAAHWAAVSRLTDSAVAGAAEGGDVATLVHLGRLGPRLLAALAHLRDDGRVTPDRFATLAREIEQQTRRAWQAAREKAPARPESYHGLAQLAVREGDVRLAVEMLLQGLSACGDQTELLDLLTRLAVATGNSEIAFDVTWAAAEKAATDPAKWCLAGSAALATGRHRGSVVAACANARKLVPGHPGACRVEVRLWLARGDPARALALLRSLGESTLRSDPALARLHARALAESGSTAREHLGELEKVELATRPPAPVLCLAFLRGLLDASPDDSRAALVADRAGELLATWPHDPDVRRLEADALFRRSELASPPWNPVRARAALWAYDRLPPSARDDLGVIAAVATLQLKALNDPVAAARTVAPFRQRGNAPLLTPLQREALGAVYIAAGKPADAIPVLERAVRDPAATAGCWVQLALAYHATRRRVEARDALDRVWDFPDWSAREQAEWFAAWRLIQSDDP